MIHSRAHVRFRAAIAGGKIQTAIHQRSRAQRDDRILVAVPHARGLEIRAIRDPRAAKEWVNIPTGKFGESSRALVDVDINAPKARRDRDVLQAEVVDVGIEGV